MDAVHHPLDVWVVSVVEPWVTSMGESFRSRDLGDEKEQECEE